MRFGRDVRDGSPTMRLSQFGDTDLRVSPLGLGCARIGGIFQGNAGGFIDLLHAARDAGINFFDTADMYSQGESESLIGRAFFGQRHRVVITSKAGYCLPAQRKLAARLKPFLRPVIRFLGLKRSVLPSGVRGAPTQDFSSSYLRTAVEGSLRRLRTDYLDLFQLHSPSAEAVARGEWLDACEELKRAGKIRHYGISVDTVAAGEAALKFTGISSLQLVMNLLEQEGAKVLLPRARERRLAVIARECLANGLLVKEERQIDLDTYCSGPEQKALRIQQLAELRRRAEAERTSLPSLALSYVVGLEGVSVALIGARSTQQLLALLKHAPEAAASPAAGAPPTR
jgi:aryl-alcohol dehydrogenase-like predicted oxidoreductase